MPTTQKNWNVERQYKNKKQNMNFEVKYEVLVIKLIILLIFKLVIIKAFSRKMAMCPERWKLDFISSPLTNSAVQKPHSVYFCHLKNAGVIWDDSKYCLFSISCVPGSELCV